MVASPLPTFALDFENGPGVAISRTRGGRTRIELESTTFSTSGEGNAYRIDTAGRVPKLKDGTSLVLRIDRANTGDPVLIVDALGTRALLDANGAPPSAGRLVKDRLYPVTFDANAQVWRINSVTPTALGFDLIGGTSTAAVRAALDLDEDGLDLPGNAVGKAISDAAKTALLPNVDLTGAVTQGFDATCDTRGRNIADRLAFGGFFFAANALHATTGQHPIDGLNLSAGGRNDGPQSFATFSFTKTSLGSDLPPGGTPGFFNGPNNADYARFASTIKQNYLTTLKYGEIDVDSIRVAQGRRDDAGGVLIHATKVFGTAEDQGGLVAIEATTEKVDPTGAVTQRMQTIKGFAEGNGGASSKTGYGFYSEAQFGNPYSAFHAGNLVPGGWQWFFTAHSSRDPGGRVCGIDGAGRARMQPGSATAPGYAFQGDEDTGLTRLAENALGLVTGGANRFFVDSAGHFSPGLDNTYDLGGINRVRNLYLAGNTLTSSSDKRLKLDITPSPLGLDFIQALQPKSFRFADGGTAVVDQPVEIDVEVPVLDEAGNEIFDLEPQFEADGVTPVWDKAGTPSGLFDARGNPIMKRRQLVVAIKRMQTERQTVMRPQRVEAPGQRRHFGFLAQDVRVALLAAGQPESAIWTLEDPDDPDSKQGLREMQLLAPLVRAVQQLAARVVALEAARP